MDSRGLEAEAAAHLAAIVDSSDDAIVSKDLDGIVRSWNRGAERLFGYTADEIVGRSIRLIIPADRQGEEDEVLRRIRSGHRVDHFETVRLRKDGSHVEISLTVSPVRDAEGAVIGASKIARDITVQKAAEGALRQSIEMKDEFLSMVSHELRTPISIVVGNGQMLVKRGDILSPQDRLQAYVDIAEQGERLQRIIENLLALTRLEAGDQPEVARLDLSTLIARTIEDFQRRFPRRTFEVAAPESVPALGEPTAVALIIENLIGNAVKYSSDGTAVEITVEMHDGQPCVRVADRGIGLEPAQIEAVFEPFFRSAAATRFAGGMGLGLAVCRKLIDAQHGSLWAEQREGGGSVFTFCLPAP